MKHGTAGRVVEAGDFRELAWLILAMATVPPDYLAATHDIELVDDCCVVTGAADHCVTGLVSGPELIIARTAVEAVASMTAT